MSIDVAIKSINDQVIRASDKVSSKTILVHVFLFIGLYTKKKVEGESEKSKKQLP